MTILAEMAAYLELKERENSEQALVIMNGNADPYLRSTLPGHITGSAFVIDIHSCKALLIHHAALGIWIQPGGHVDPGEQPVDAALRETTEETGLAVQLLQPQIFDLDIHPIPANPRKNEPDHYHVDVRYLVSADSSKTVTINECESNDYEWVDLACLAHEPTSVGRMAMLALQFINARNHS